MGRHTLEEYLYCFTNLLASKTALEDITISVFSADFCFVSEVNDTPALYTRPSLSVHQIFFFFPVKVFRLQQLPQDSGHFSIFQNKQLLCMLGVIQSPSSTDKEEASFTYVPEIRTIVIQIFKNPSIFIAECSSLFDIHLT